MSNLLIVKQDGVYNKTKLRGRFAVTRDQAMDERHLGAAARDASKTMIEQLAKQGYEHTGSDFDVRGPLRHLEFSENSAPDPGPDAYPDFRDKEKFASWNRLEQDRIARKADEALEYLDFIIEGEFLKRNIDSYRAMDGLGGAVILGAKGTRD